MCLIRQSYVYSILGHNAYLGMLYLDLYHTHPVLLAFVEILCKEKAAKAGIMEDQGMENDLNLQRVGNQTPIKGMQ